MELRQRLLSNRSTFGRFACKELLNSKEVEFAKLQLIHYETFET